MRPKKYNASLTIFSGLHIGGDICKVVHDENSILEMHSFPQRSPKRFFFLGLKPISDWIILILLDAFLGNGKSGSCNLANIFWFSGFTVCTVWEGADLMKPNTPGFHNEQWWAVRCACCVTFLPSPPVYRDHNCDVISSSSSQERLTLASLITCNSVAPYLNVETVTMLKVVNMTWVNLHALHYKKIIFLISIFIHVFQ